MSQSQVTETIKDTFLAKKQLCWCKVGTAQLGLLAAHWSLRQALEVLSGLRYSAGEPALTSFSLCSSPKD